MLSNKQLRCIELMITTDKKQKEIAKEISVAESTIIDWKKEDEFKTEMHIQMNAYFKDISREAQRVMRNLLKDKNSQVRFQASKDILDRAGFKATDRLDIQGAVPVIISGDDNLAE